MDPRTPSAMRSRATPTVSRVFDDGAVVELIFDAEAGRTALAIARPGAAPAFEQDLQTPSGERLRPYSAANSLIASRCVLLPSAVTPYGDKARLLAAIGAYLRRYVELSPVFEQIAAHYVLLSWLHDGFSDLPYLRLRGDYGTGKTRALLVIGSICYRPFFASGASTVSPIFHILDVFGGTLVLDEADQRFSDATADLTKILNNGTTDGLPVLRTMSNKDRELNPRAFRVYGPKLVGMRSGFADPALESRFITEETGARPLRSGVPLHLPAAFRAEALDLRNQLLAFRFAERAAVRVETGRAIAGVEARTNQAALALLSLMDDGDLRARIGETLLRRDDAVRAARAQTHEAVMIRALLEVMASAKTPIAAVSAVAERFNGACAGELGRPMTPRWVGGFLRERLRLPTVKSNGLYGVPRRELAKIEALAERFDVPRPSGAGPP